MTRMAELLTAGGWPVEFESEDETDVPCAWDEARQDYVCPQECKITWGNWYLYDHGEFYMDHPDGFPVADCGLFAFLAAVHQAWHEVTKAAAR